LELAAYRIDLLYILESDPPRAHVRRPKTSGAFACRLGRTTTSEIAQG
jgi:hypothetical protein